MPSNSSKRTVKTRVRKQTGTKRHLIHLKFVEFIEAVPDAVVVVNRRGGIDLVNGQTEKMFGYNRKDLLGKSVETLLPVRFRKTHAQHLSRYFAESPRARPMGIGLDLAGRHRDGREFPVDISLSPLQTPEGVVTMAVVRDVTKRKLVSEELALKQARLLDLASDAIMVLDLNGTIHYWNHGAQRLYGWTSQEAVGKQMSALLHTVFPKPVPEIVEALLREGRWEGELIQTAKDGKRMTVLSHCTLQRGEDGEPLAILDISHDITEQKQSEATIRSLLDISRKLNSTLDVDALMDALVVEVINLIDAEGGFAGLRAAQGMVCCHKYFKDSQAIPLEYCFPPGQGLPGWVAIHKVPYLTNDAALDTQFVPEMRERLGVRSAVSTPILDLQGEAIGFFQLINKKGGSGFTPSDLEKLMAVSEAASVAVQNALAYRKIQLEEKALAELSGSLLHLRDEEQRRVGRELHDTTGQTLVALKMNLGRVNKSSDLLDASAREALSESLALTDQCVREIRTLSHLLHPPLLDEAGLSSALPWFARGFAERSGIRVALDLPPDLGRLPRELEITLFRIVQECLTNIHRHSGSRTAKIRIVRNPSTLLLEVEDEGRGMPPEVIQGATEISARVGVGIAGMRERLHQLGGRLEIHSGSRGAKVRAILPLGGGAA